MHDVGGGGNLIFRDIDLIPLLTIKIFYEGSNSRIKMGNFCNQEAARGQIRPQNGFKTIRLYSIQRFLNT